MATLKDPDRLKAYLDAVRNYESGIYITFSLNATATAFLLSLGVTTDCVKELIYKHVCELSGEIDEVEEKRPIWCDEFEFHHDLRILVSGTKVYIETVLHYELPVRANASWIEIVNIHKV